MTESDVEHTEARDSDGEEPQDTHQHCLSPPPLLLLQHKQLPDHPCYITQSPSSFLHHPLLFFLSLVPLTALYPVPFYLLEDLMPSPLMQLCSVFHSQLLGLPFPNITSSPLVSVMPVSFIPPNFIEHMVQLLPSSTVSALPLKLLPSSQLRHVDCCYFVALGDSTI